MKKFNGFLVLLLPILLLLESSCRKEEHVFVGTPPEQGLVAGSNVANLLVRMATNDGSADNIIDGASCISLKLPLTVIVNDTEIIVDGPEDFDTIEDILDNDDGESDGDEGDNLEIIFPVTVVFADFMETTVSGADELQVFVDGCQEGSDDDIECVDILYPVTVSLYNTNSEVFDTVSLTGDRELYGFVKALDSNDVVNIKFPVAVILSDESEVQVADLTGLENVIESAKDDCDEDDNNDFKDDDCGDCGTDPFSAVWAACSEWEAHKFEMNDEKLDKQYEDLLFDFQEDGAVLAVSDTETFVGTWSSTGSGNSIELTFDIPGLDDFSAIWNLEEIKQKSDDIVDVRLYRGKDELHIQSTCSEEDSDED